MADNGKSDGNMNKNENEENILWTDGTGTILKLAVVPSADGDAGIKNVGQLVYMFNHFVLAFIDIYIIVADAQALGLSNDDKDNVDDVSIDPSPKDGEEGGIYLKKAENYQAENMTRGGKGEEGGRGLVSLPGDGGGECKGQKRPGSPSGAREEKNPVKKSRNNE